MQERLQATNETPVQKLAKFQSNVRENLSRHADISEINSEITRLSQNQLRDSNWNLPKKNAEQIQALIAKLEQNNQGILIQQSANYKVERETDYNLNDAVKLRALSYIPDEAIAKMKSEFEDGNFQKQEEIRQNLPLLMQIWRNQVATVEKNEKKTPQDIKKINKLNRALIDAQEILNPPKK